MRKNVNLGIFTNERTNKTLIYYPVAKNANSSAKLFLIEHLGLKNKFYFIEDEIPRHKHTKEIYNQYKGKMNLIDFLPPYSPFKKVDTKVDTDEKCCLVRDPIKRFISSYKNRILFHKDRGFLNHSLDMIIDKLENNMFENRHFLPQNYWLGNDLKYFRKKLKVNSGDIVTKEDLFRYGKTYVDFYKINDETYLMDF